MPDKSDPVSDEFGIGRGFTAASDALVLKLILSRLLSRSWPARRSWDGGALPGLNRRRAKLPFRVPANTMAAP
jgi:hypothetical protein